MNYKAMWERLREEIKWQSQIQPTVWAWAVILAYIHFIEELAAYKEDHDKDRKSSDCTLE